MFLNGLPLARARSYCWAGTGRGLEGRLGAACRRRAAGRRATGTEVWRRPRAAAEKAGASPRAPQRRRKELHDVFKGAGVVVARDALATSVVDRAPCRTPRKYGVAEAD